MSLRGGFLGCSKNSKEAREARAERTRENVQGIKSDYRRPKQTVSIQKSCNKALRSKLSQITSGTAQES